MAWKFRVKLVTPAITNSIVIRKDKSAPVWGNGGYTTFFKGTGVASPVIWQTQTDEIIEPTQHHLKTTWIAQLYNLNITIKIHLDKATDIS